MENEMKTGIELITAERQRQIDVEGWTPEHDAEHAKGELVEASTQYAEYARFLVRTERQDGERYFRGLQIATAPASVRCVAMLKTREL